MTPLKQYSLADAKTKHYEKKMAASVSARSAALKLRQLWFWWFGFHCDQS
jgi:hypothetical protein